MNWGDVQVDASTSSALGARPKSSLPGVVWPIILTGDAALMELLQTQFRESERATPSLIRSHQLAQINRLAMHAYEHSPFWRRRLDAAGFSSSSGSGRWLDALPILTRAEVKSAGNTIFADPVPPSHGNVRRLKTSGSTGTPLEVAKTDLAQLFWHAITLRDSLWHGRDLTGKLAAIRVGAERKEYPGWGPAYLGYDNGPSMTFDAREDIDAQLDWLVTEQPQVLLTHASNLHALASRSIARGERLSHLREARSYSECLPHDLRNLVREAWDVPLTDIYSTNETGYVALQCPVSGLYHIQSEDVMLEIVSDSGQVCSAGETGRVVATSLHNFAMPLIRYDLGDYATVGGACSCGRTLPTLERIVGRTRNMLKLSGGRTVWPGFPMNTLVRLNAILELRMIQHSLEEIEIELVLARALTATEETTLSDAVRTRLQHPFHVRLTPVARIERGPGHKREDFECRVT